MNETKWNARKPISVTPRKIFYTRGVIMRMKCVKTKNKDEIQRET